MDNSWPDAQMSDTRFDPLLDALVQLTKLYDNPFSRDALIAGLPVEDGNMQTKQFQVAAERAGLSSRLIKRDLSKLSNLTLPALLLLNNRQTAILLSLEGEKAKIMRPELGDAEEEIQIEQLSEQFSGYVFLIKQRHKFSGIQDNTLDLAVNHWFWGAMARSWKIYRDVLIASVLINVFALSGPIFTRNVYDRVIPNDALGTLWTFAIGITIVYTFDFLLRMLRAYFLDIAGKKSDIILSSIIFRKVQATELALKPKTVGSFAKQLQDFESIRNMITSTSMAILVDLPFTVLFLAVIYIMAGKLVVVPIVCMLLIFFYSLWAQRSIKYTVDQSSRASVEKSGLLIESLNAPESVRAYNMQSQNQKKWEESTAVIADWSNRTKLISTSVGSFSNFVQQMATVAVIVYGVYLIKDAQLTMGGLIAVSMLLGRTLAPMRQLASIATSMHSSKIAFEALDKLMQNDVEIDFNKHYVSKPKLSGNIQFNAIDFAYPESEVKQISQANFSIKPGEKIAILGRIGSGKSTIAKLLMRFYKPSEGQILVDGIDIQQINPYELRHNIGYVPQHVQLFFGSIKDNIKLGADWVDNERVEMIARLAGVTDFTDSHPMGLDMPVGEGGQSLSGGQRQLVALARALLLYPQILILDEPSSGMDTASEQALLKRLKPIIKDRTVIIITHRNSLLTLVDRLMVVEAGQLLADGPKENVIQQLKGGQS